MGQCAPSSPTGHWSDSIADDDIAVVLAPPTSMDRHDRSRTFESQRQLHFLQPHNSSGRWLVDQDEVKRVMILQSDEVLFKAGQLKMNGFKKEMQRQQRLPVLRLKMKANVGRFYTSHYLSMFPRESIPQLSCESSDSSLSSTGSSFSSSRDSSAVDRSLPPMTPIKCPMTDESLFDLTIIGSLGLVPRDEDYDVLRPSRRHLKGHCQSTPDHCIVLMNTRSKSPLAVCVLEEASQSSLIRVYSTKKMTLTQQCATTTKQLGLDWIEEYALYNWAEVEPKGDFPHISFAIFLARTFHTCSPVLPRYVASFELPSGSYSDVQSPVMRIMARAESDRHMSGCAQIWMQEDETMGDSRKSSDHSFRINLAQGLDPTLFICFTAIADEILENSMRARCKIQTRGLPRTDSFSLAKKRMQARRSTDSDGFTCKPDLCGYSEYNFLNY